MKYLPPLLTLLFIAAVASWTLRQEGGTEEDSANAAPEKARVFSDEVERFKVYSFVHQEFMMTEKVNKTENDWKKKLTPQQYAVARKKGTEVAFTGKYWNNHDAGIYQCVCCGIDLFSSATKFDSGTGWPSFFEPLAKENIEVVSDFSLLRPRNEVRCSRCGAHLGHVFNDGPEPAGLRYCLNSASLNFIPTAKK